MELSYQDGLNKAVKQALELLDTQTNPVILIDGHAGSGKTTFATELRDLVFTEASQAPALIQMDDLYPGWEGLRAGSTYFTHNILQPLRSGRTAHWQVWDWANNRRGNSAEIGNGWREFAGNNLLIVEGCGSLSRVNQELADLAIWIESDQSVRHMRLKERHGELFDAHWATWFSQEGEFYQQERSRELADFSVLN